MRRREMVLLLGAAAAVSRQDAWAQEPALPVIGFLADASLDSMRARVAAFRRGLAEIGYAEKRNVAFDWRVADPAGGQPKALAADLVTRRAALILAIGDRAAAAAKEATSTVPIVFISGIDPQKNGSAAGAERKRNVTGVSWFGPDLAPARLGILRQIVSKTTVPGVLLDANLADAAQTFAAVEAASEKTAPRPVALRVRSAGELDAAFATLAAQRVGALVVGASDLFTDARAQLVALALRRNVPAVYAAREIAADGGLASLGQSVTDAFRRAGVYAGWILKGAQPADLPILPSVKLELVINLKSAAAFGLDVSPNILAAADEVIR